MGPLPAFEVAGGLILLLIGLDMLEARRIPNSRKISCPAIAKLVSTMKHVSAPLRAMRLRRGASAVCVMARKEGIAANGSTRKKIELNASSEKRTIGAWLNSFRAVVAGFVQITL